MAQPIKTISAKPRRFIPSSSKEFSEGAKDVADRPLVINYRLLTREDKLNLQSMGNIVNRPGQDGETPTLTRLGDVAQYIWRSAALSVENVILDDVPKEKVSGPEKDRLWYTEGMDAEILEFVVHVQTESFLTESEVKN